MGFITVALIKFASRSLLAKVHRKKNPEVEKLDGNQVVRITFRGPMVVSRFWLLGERSKVR